MLLRKRLGLRSKISKKWLASMPRFALGCAFHPFFTSLTHAVFRKHDHTRISHKLWVGLWSLTLCGFCWSNCSWKYGRALSIPRWIFVVVASHIAQVFIVTTSMNRRHCYTRQQLFLLMSGFAPTEESTIRGCKANYFSFPFRSHCFSGVTASPQPAGACRRRHAPRAR